MKLIIEIFTKTIRTNPLSRIISGELKTNLQIIIELLI